MEQIRPVRTKTRMNDVPRWHHSHSNKLSVIGFNSVNYPVRKTLILKSNAVDVRIHPDASQKGWVVEYEIRHCPDSVTKGGVWMSENDLKTAFDLSDVCERRFGQKVLDTYGGDVAHQGMYIRYHEFLNIPGPGTGDDGDPNVSIYIDEMITASVILLLN